MEGETEGRRELDKRVPDCSTVPREKDKSVSSPWMKGGNINMERTSSSTGNINSSLGEEELTIHIYRDYCFVMV